MVHHERMTRDWKRLGLAIKARREELGLATQQALADAAGVKRQTVNALEKGTERTRMPQTISLVEKALQWEPGTASRILATESTGTQNGVTARLADGMPVRIAQELSAGQVVDTEVVELSLPGTPFKLVGILKQDAPAADMDPEELAKALQEWSRMQRAMRDIASDQSRSPDRP